MAVDRAEAALIGEAAAAARAWRQRTGGRIVGCLGADVPTEIIVAAGLYPLRIGLGLARPIAAAAPFTERGDSDIVGALLELLIDGSHDVLDHLVIGNTPVFHVTLFNFLREARRQGHRVGGPPISLFEMHHGGGPIVDALNRQSCERLAATMSAIGAPVTPASLAEAIGWGNARRVAATELAARRRTTPAALSGTTAQVALARLHMLPFALPDPPTDEATRGPRLLFSGSDTGHLAHYPLVEAAGCTIVADDHDWGDPVLMAPIATGGDPIAAIARATTGQPPRAARWPSAERIGSVVARALAARVDGVVFWLSDEDHASNWDLPPLTDALAAEGIPSLDLGPQPLRGVDGGAITARVAGWLATLPASRSIEVTA